jgi:hypothetical protein
MSGRERAPRRAALGLYGPLSEESVASFFGRLPVLACSSGHHFVDQLGGGEGARCAMFGCHLPLEVIPPAAAD